ncbi:hypothetical protein NHF46_08260 [Arthrobacter alpinus]|nr:hypothetical protein [Arthrobacter alpinus]
MVLINGPVKELHSTFDPVGHGVGGQVQGLGCREAAAASRQEMP